MANNDVRVHLKSIIKNLYDIKIPNGMSCIHENEVNKIDECNLHHDMINTSKLTKILNVLSISDFISLNKQLKREPYPMPKINDMLLKLEDFWYTASLDLNMGYYHI